MKNRDKVEKRKYRNKIESRKNCDEKKGGKM